MNLPDSTHRIFLDEAAEVAGDSTCERRRCGAVIVAGDVVIGKGFNSPPGGLESQRRCGADKYSLDKKVTDKTCCIHAEERAIIDALRKNPGMIEGSTMYFAGIDENGKRVPSGDPYCTLCSKLAVEVRIGFWVLEQKEGIKIYDSKTYNRLSFDYGKK